MTDFDLIIFDCDGTLVDSEYLNCSATAEILAEFGVEGYTGERVMEEYAGQTLKNIARSIEKKDNVIIPDNISELYVKRVSQNMQSQLKFVDGAKETIELASKMTKICVASNGERSNIIQSLSLAGYDPYFNEKNIFSKIQVHNPKPAPDLFLFAADQMKIAPERCLVIEDSPTGVEAAIAANMTVWGFTAAHPDTTKQAGKLQQAGAQQIFDNFIHIAHALNLKKPLCGAA